jgi:DNA-binding IclR family transcriptional regulator
MECTVSVSSAEITGDSPETKLVPAVVRAKLILDAVAEGTSPRAVSELARQLDLPRSTVHGLCRTLVDLGLLVRVDQTSYSLGPHVLVWSNAFDMQSSLSSAFKVVASSLERVETVNLSILAGQEVMYVGCKQGTDPLGVRFREGLRFPAPFSATGKAIMSTMTDTEVERLFGNEWPTPSTSTSVRNVDELLGELAETRKRGYSIDNGQLREAMTCFGAPVFGPGRSTTAIAGIAIAVLANGLSEEHSIEVSGAVRSIAQELSRRLGAPPREQD